MHRRSVGLVFALLSSSLASCADGHFGPEPGRSDDPIQTDRLRYRAVRLGGEGTYTRFGFKLIARFRNATDRIVYLARCFPDSPVPIYGIRLLQPDDPEGAGYSPNWGCVGHDRQFAVRPDESRTDTLTISGPNGWDGHTGIPRGVLAGRFQVFYAADFCPGECLEPVPDTLVSSNTFEVQLDR